MAKSVAESARCVVFWSERGKSHMIERGDRIPSVPVKVIDGNGISDGMSDAVLGTGKVVFFSVPGAFTPTCHTNHLPGFIANAEKLRAEGVSRIVCAATNDHHVMKSWAEATDALGEVDFIADGNGLFAKALGFDKNMSEFGMGQRYRRAAMLVDNGTVEAVFVEEVGGVSVSGAPAILLALQTSRK
jgi:peroxiredoxin